MRLSDFIGRPYQKSILSLFSLSYFIILEGYVEYCSLIWLSSKTAWSIQWFQQWLWCPCSGVILPNAEWSFPTGIFSSGSFFYLFIFFLLPFVNGKQLPLLSCKWDQFFLSSSLSCPIYQIQLTVTNACCILFFSLFARATSSFGASSTFRRSWRQLCSRMFLSCIAWTASSQPLRAGFSPSATRSLTYCLMY